MITTLPCSTPEQINFMIFGGYPQENYFLVLKIFTTLYDLFSDDIKVFGLETFTMSVW